MKLKNKQTGEIVDVESLGHADSLKGKFGYQVTLSWKIDEHLDTCKTYNSLAELNAEWEDAPEPKEYWYIAELCAGLQKKQDTDNGEDRFNKQIGNYFETKEEAEKAVEKLKAWKRVKRDLVSLNWQRERDGSFSVWGEFKTGNTLRADVYLDIHSKDLDICFGGEE